ncbi:MAG: hypothetical protein V4724_35135 [Pseudomonadota bacterium]
MERFPRGMRGAGSGEGRIIAIKYDRNIADSRAGNLLRYRHIFAFVAVMDIASQYVDFHGALFHLHAAEELLNESFQAFFQALSQHSTPGFGN